MCYHTAKGQQALSAVNFFYNEPWLNVQRCHFQNADTKISDLEGFHSVLNEIETVHFYGTVALY